MGYKFNALLDVVSLRNGSEEATYILEVTKLISNGLECKLINVLQDLLSSSHPDQIVTNC